MEIATSVAEVKKRESELWLDDPINENRGRSNRAYNTRCAGVAEHKRQRYAEGKTAHPPPM
jgi:hypothetical protein